MHISLAPMEGVVDYPMRLLLTELGGYDRCVTEFVRVTDTLLPDKVFFRYCPELKTDGHTLNGVPVYLQLLGGEPAPVAANARKAARLGAAGIDLNFGCPAKSVNKSNGGSILLCKPDQVVAVVQAVRDEVDPAVPVNVKMRLGYEDDFNFDEIAEKVLGLGINELCVHARTKLQGYKPPAYWGRVIKAATLAPASQLIINGEIWNPGDARRALTESGFGKIMLGRCALACPDLGLQIKADLSGEEYTPMQWPSVFELVQTQFARSDKTNLRYVGNRTKQWLAYLKRTYEGADLIFSSIKRLRDQESFLNAFREHEKSFVNGLSTGTGIGTIEKPSAIHVS